MERRLFMPGACTLGEAAPAFELLDFGRQLESLTEAARMACLNCVQLKRCGEQIDGIVPELQKSGVETTVVAAKIVTPEPFPDEVKRSSFMVAEPVLEWEPGQLPLQARDALAIMRLTDRSRQASARLSTGQKQTIKALAAAHEADINVLAEAHGVIIGTGKSQAFEHLTRVFAFCAGLMGRTAFTPAESAKFLAVSDLYIRDVALLRAGYGDDAERLARCHDPEYYTRLWEYYGTRYNLTSAAFRSLIHENPTEPTALLDAHIESNPHLVRGASPEAPPELKAIATYRPRREDTEEALKAGRKSLERYLSDDRFTQAYLNQLLNQYQEAAGEAAEAYLDRLQRLEQLGTEFGVKMTPGHMRYLAARSVTLPVSREELLTLYNDRALAQGNYGRSKLEPTEQPAANVSLQRWMIRRAATTYASETEPRQVLDTLAKLLRREYFQETDDFNLVKARDSHCIDEAGIRAIIPTDLFLELQTAERAAIIYAANLAPFLGDVQLTPDELAGAWGVTQPEHVANLAAPYLMWQTASGKDRDNFWHNCRAKIINKLQNPQPPSTYDALIADVRQELQNSWLAEGLNLDSPIGQRAIAHAVAAASIHRSRRGLQPKTALIAIRGYLREVRTMLRFPLTEAERFACALRYGAEYWQHLDAYGSERLMAIMKRQALAVYDFSDESETPVAESAAIEVTVTAETDADEAGEQPVATPVAPAVFEPANPAEEPLELADAPVARVEVAKPAPQAERREPPRPVLPPPPLPPPQSRLRSPTLPRPPIPQRRMPRGVMPPIPSGPPAVRPRPQVAAPEAAPKKPEPRKAPSDHRLATLVNQKLETLPYPVQAAFYLAYSTPARFTFEMRQEGWHDIAKVVAHFNTPEHPLETKHDLLNYVRDHLRPAILRQLEEGES